MPSSASAIPVGSQFTPELIDLEEFLKAAVAHSGTKAALVGAVTKAPVRVKPYKKPPTRRQGSLPIEAAAQYGLLEPGTYKITPLGERLAGLSAPDVFDEFAKHILRTLGGLRVVEAVQQMQLEGHSVTGDSLAEHLTNQGFPVGEHNTQINALRMWLAKAGVFSAAKSRGPSVWEVDSVRKQALMGLTDDEIAALASLTEEQRAFALTLCALEPSGWVAASEVRNLAEANHDVRFGRGNLRPILEPLADLGLLEFQSGGTSGGKAAQVKTTPKFQKEVLEPFLEKTVKDLDTVLMSYFKKAPADIYADLDSSDKSKKGRALEAYAVRIMRLLRFRFLGWRVRAKDAGYGEVDVVMVRVAAGVPTRWQVQCKNTPGSKVDLEDVAKEVGISLLTKATHILFITNSSFTRDAVTYANEVMINTALTIYLLDRRDFEKIKKNETALAEILNAKAEEASRLKRGESMWEF